MDINISIDLGHVARDLSLPLDQVQRTIELLDEGNTVPFITRYRKDHTGGLDEEQIRHVQAAVTKLRQLEERKKTILKSIEAQEKLTPELAEKILSARSIKHLEDLYLPFKPKKQTLATIARLRGLEPLANEILDAAPAADQLEARAAEFINPEHKLHSVADVLSGVGHILAERFSERADVRHRLRRIFQRSGRLLTTRIEPEKTSPATDPSDPTDQSDPMEATPPGAADVADVIVAVATESPVDVETAETDSAEAPDHLPPITDEELGLEHDDDDEAGEPEHDEAAADLGAAAAENLAESAEPPAPEHTPEQTASPEPSPETPHETPHAVSPAPLAAVVASVIAAPKPDAKRQARIAAREAKKKKRQKLLESAFKDYYNYQEPLGRVPPHRVLAINRGERARVLRVKIDADLDAMWREAEEMLVPREHPHAEFLRGWLRDALGRLVFPSLERELRREMTERAEMHAVDVFVRNLRKLLLQPPVHGRRVLAIDPGFRSGCKLVELDEFGNVMDHGMIHVIGSDQHRQMCRSRLVDAIQKHNVSVIAIGNGTACRETELLVADVISTELKDRDIAYVIVNEAGASVYSTSPIGREELPKFDATVRGAVSIGRRLLDPLSELVKINAANIGVGLYQHDVKAKHLQDSLDAVVESCVNYVGVDVNTASPALLRYVSGLNQLTARRLYEYRLQHGPFRDREQFKNVPGFGDATFVQAAGFLKILGGENPLDATWIHPESYTVAQRVLDKLGSNVAELKPQVVPVPVAVAAPPAVTVPLEVSPLATADPATDASTDKTNDAPVIAAETAIEAGDAIHTSHVSHSSHETDGNDGMNGTNATIEPAIAPPAPEPLASRVAKVDAASLAQELSIGRLSLDDILASLARPGRDPREDLPPPVFRRGIMKLEDLTPGMELNGTVLNVVDFGAFVDIGLSDSALVHISRLADRYVRDPHEVVGVGDVLKVWVVEVDKQRRRVSLTAIAPGSEKPHEQRQRPPRPEQPRQRPPRPQQSQPAAAGDGPPPPPRSSRPSRPADSRKSVRPPKFVQQPDRKPKPVKPITKGMIDGKEPMRTFSDLLQFYKKKQDGDEAEPEAGK